MTNTTAEQLVSKTKEEIIKEAKRIEESLLHSSKGHFAAAHFWSNFHLWVGIPTVICSTLAGASALGQFDPKHIVSGILLLIVSVLTAVMTFINPNEKVSVHKNAGNKYDALMNKVRIFSAIDCWGTETEAVLTAQLKQFSEQKDKLNDGCPQIPRWAYLIAKKGIDSGEGDFKVDNQAI